MFVYLKSMIELMSHSEDQKESSVILENNIIIDHWLSLAAETETWCAVAMTLTNLGHKFAPPWTHPLPSIPFLVLNALRCLGVCVCMQKWEPLYRERKIGREQRTFIRHFYNFTHTYATAWAMEKSKQP